MVAFGLEEWREDFICLAQTEGVVKIKKYDEKVSDALGGLYVYFAGFVTECEDESLPDELADAIEDRRCLLYDFWEHKPCPK